MPATTEYNELVKKQTVKLLIALFAGLISLVAAKFTESPQRPYIEPGYYKVTQFIDGDTIEVDMNGKLEKVRFIGVDTPETHDPRKPVQCFGQAAADFTKKMIGSSSVRLETDPINTNRDRYQRLLRYIYLPDGRLVNAEIIKEGYGFAYLSFPFTKLDEFRNLENQSREQGKGLWGTCNPTLDSQGYIHSKPEN